MKITRYIYTSFLCCTLLSTQAMQSRKLLELVAAVSSSTMSLKATSLKKRKLDDLNKDTTQSRLVPEDTSIALISITTEPTLKKQKVADEPPCIKGARYKWQLPVKNEALVKCIMKNHGLCSAVAQTLITRGYTTENEIESYVETLYERDVANPSLLLNAQKVVDRITQAIHNKEKILVCGDYDVDGMTSSALLIHCLEPLGADISYHIPNRLKDGYGLKAKTIEEAAPLGFKVVITVDNGITSFEPAKKAHELGIDLIITDHHLAHDGVPGAFAVVNPNQPDCAYPFKHLAGVGVAFKLMTLLYQQNNLTLPDKAYELMMLGSIADVVQLTGENRYWVRYGLDLVNKTGGSISFRKLLQNYGTQNPTIDSTAVAFGLAPQLNALGRLADANEGVRFLLDIDQSTVDNIGNMLHAYNNDRKKIQANMFNEIKNKIKAREIDLDRERIIIVSSSDFHPGVNGLVASKLVEKYYKPAIVCTEVADEHGETILKGSARSIAAFHLFDALFQCEDLLMGWGGHKVAAGLAFKKANLQALKKRMEHIFVDTVKPRDTINRHIIDAESSFINLVPKMIEDFQKLAPFGNENPQPTLLFDHVRVVDQAVDKKGKQQANPQWLGKNKAGHCKCIVIEQGKERTLKFFFRPDMFYRLKELKERGREFKLIGTPDDNYWNGKRSIEINGVDIEAIQ